jgi:hypothetical protein
MSRVLGIVGIGCGKHIYCTFMASIERGCVHAKRSGGLASFFLRPTKKGEEKTHDGCRQGR